MKIERVGARGTACGKRHMAWVTLAGALGLLIVLPSTAASSPDSDPWYRATLEQGETNGYRWTVNAKGPKHKPLREICTLVSMVEPPQEGAPYVEEMDATDCGRLLKETSSVSGSVAFGSGASRLTILAALYRPAVRKVVFLLDTGERRVYLSRAPKIPRRLTRGIPLFRYLVASFDGETCIRRVTTFDGKGSVVGSDVSPPCPPGTGNL
jgi:hypothetical protein